jgi:hypothetical protein
MFASGELIMKASIGVKAEMTSETTRDDITYTKLKAGSPVALDVGVKPDFSRFKSRSNASRNSRSWGTLNLRINSSALMQRTSRKPFASSVSECSQA